MLHGLQRQPRLARTGIQIVAQMHLRQLAQDVGVQRDVAFARQHAVETRHQLHALLVRELAQRREAAQQRRTALLRFQRIDVRFERTRHRRDLRREPQRNHLLLPCARLGIRIESQRQQQRTRGLRMTTGRDDRFRQ